MKNIVAIDPSMSSTGVAWGTGEYDFRVRCFESKKLGDSVWHRVKRLEALVASINDVVLQAQPGIVLIEQYAYSKNMGGQMFLGEFGGILRWHLVEHTPHVIEVSPTSLKKFATGSGAAKKEMVMAHIAKRWGHIFDSSDSADAYVMYRMGLVLAGRCAPDNKDQEEAIAKLCSNHWVSRDELQKSCQ